MNDLETTRQHHTALTVVCRYCHAPIGRDCINRNSGRPLANLPAHPIRITDAEKDTRP